MYWVGQVRNCQLSVHVSRDVYIMCIWGLLLGTFVTCFPSEPLYQTYRATVITKEIRRQTVCRNISKTSVDYAMDSAARRSGTGTATATGNGAPRGSPVPTTGQSTLWQDLAAVRDSGVLEQLGPERCKYQEVRDWPEPRRDYRKRNRWCEEKRNGRCRIKF